MSNPTEVDAQLARAAEKKIREDDLFEALRVRFAKAWWDGYAQGVEDAREGAVTLQNPWETL